ncbi:MAG: hypothetical protein ACFFG0_36270 [Candidatus Thorarchaeota archaeon]
MTKKKSKIKKFYTDFKDENPDLVSFDLDDIDVNVDITLDEAYDEYINKDREKGSDKKKDK